MGDICFSTSGPVKHLNAVHGVLMPGSTIFTINDHDVLEVLVFNYLPVQFVLFSSNLCQQQTSSTSLTK